MENIVLGFNLALEDQSIEDINLAFKDWMRTSEDMPTPANILKLSSERKTLRLSKTKTNKPQQAPVIEGKLYPWVYKEYPQASADGSVEAFFDFHRNQPNDVKRYGFEWLKYAADFLSYPKNLAYEFYSQMDLGK